MKMVIWIPSAHIQCCVGTSRANETKILEKGFHLIEIGRGEAGVGNIGYFDHDFPSKGGKRGSRGGLTTFKTFYLRLSVEEFLNELTRDFPLPEPGEILSSA